MSKENILNNKAQILAIIFVSVVISILANFTISKFSKAWGDDELLLSKLEDNAGEVIEILNNHYKKKAQDLEKNRNNELKSSSKDLYAEHMPYVGNKNAKVTIVEFFDYNCGYCKRVFPALNKALQEKLDIKVVFIDFPILGASSVVKAKASIAANLLDSKNYLAAHEALIKSGNISSVEEAADILKNIGYNKDKLTDKINSQEVNKIVKSNRDLAMRLAVNGTPAFVINDEFYQGNLSYNIIKKLVNK